MDVNERKHFDKRHLYRSAKYRGWVVQLRMYDSVKDSYWCLDLPYIQSEQWVKPDELEDFVL